MKRKNLFSTIWSAILVAALVMATTPSVMSAAQVGTPAGTAIVNTATVNYSAGSIAREATASLTLHVGQKIVIDMGTALSALNTVDGTTVYKTFTITNMGNGADPMTLSTSGTFGTWTVSIVGESDETVVSAIGPIASGSSFTGRIKVVIPAGEADGTNHAITLRATSTAASAGDIVIANVGHYEETSWTVTVAKPVLSFSVTPTYSGNKLPGEQQSYALTVTNTGSAATNGNSTITWKYDDALLSNEAAAGGSLAAGTATWTIGSLAATNGTATVTFTADIDQAAHNGTGVTAGTTITCGGAGTLVTFNDGLVNHDVNIAAPTSLTVGTSHGVLFTRVTNDAAGAPGNAVSYQFTVKNMGNASDDFTFTDVHASGSTFTAAPVIGATSGASDLTSPLTIAAGATQTVWVTYVVNANAEDAATYVYTVTAGTAGTPVAIGGQLSTPYTVTTSVTAPVITVTIAPPVKKSGFTGSDATAPVPGDVIEYTVSIANDGSGPATSITSTNLGQSAALGTNSLEAHGVDLAPDGATWTNGKLQTQAATVGDVTMTVSHYDTATGELQISVNSLPAHSTAKYRYQVKIN